MRTVIVTVLAACAALAQAPLPGPIVGGGGGIVTTGTAVQKANGSGGLTPLLTSDTVQISGVGVGGAATGQGGVYVKDLGDTSGWATYNCDNDGSTTTRCAYNFRKNGFLNWSLTNDPSNFFGLNHYNPATGVFVNNIWAANVTQTVFYNNANGVWKFIYGLAAVDSSGATVQVGTNGLSSNKLFLSNCSSAASPAVCAANASGSVVVAAAATTVVVNTSVVTANSQIQLTFDSSLGTRLSVTCNTTIVQPTVSARVAATSFTITLPSAPTTNPACISYTIIN